MTTVASGARPVKVAYFINQYPGISHSFVRREIQALERAGASVARFAIRPSKDDIISPEDKAEDALTSHIVRSAKPGLAVAMVRTFFLRPIGSFKAFGSALSMGVKSEAGLFRHVLYFLEALVLADWLRAGGLDHVHAHFGTNATTIAMLAAPLADASFSMTVHGPEEFEKPALISLKKKIENAAFTAGVSRFGASQLKKVSDPAVWDRIKIVRCGIEKEFYKGPPVAPGKEPIFVAVGRLCAEKAQIDLVEAAAKVKASGRNLKIILVGDGPMRADIEAAIARHDLHNVIELAGWKTPTEVRGLIEKARVFVLPSFAEGLPVSIMEALVLQRPVISTYIAGIPELVTPACGWIVPAGDVDAIADAMIAAIDAEDYEIEAMGVAGKARTTEMHDIDTEAAKLIGHFTAALAVGKAAAR